MKIYLYGPSGSGKSCVGRILADELNFQFLDLDSEIEKSLGSTISDFISQRGEEPFRAVESEILKNCVNRSQALVIALGGGALLNDESRNLVQSSGQVVFLETTPSVLLSRLQQDINQRPLLMCGDLETSLLSLLKERSSHYASFPVRVDAMQLPEQVVWRIQQRLGRFHLCKMEPEYDVLVQEGGLGDVGSLFKPYLGESVAMVVSDTNVAPLYAQSVLSSLRVAGFTPSQVNIPAGEVHKTLKTVSHLWHSFLEADLDRKSTVIALGGGVVGDLAGFTAATYMRGCRWLSLPTTLLAMVDSGIGGKTGFDLAQGKNLIGAFHPPAFVLADPNVLKTLPARELRAGLAEVVKHGVVADPELFSLSIHGWDDVLANLPKIVRRGMAVKIRIVEEDPFEQGFRAALNFGHTIGHALELVSGFSLLHGEAVAIGMVVEAKLAERLSIAEAGLAEMIRNGLMNLGLPVDIPPKFTHEDLINAMKMDKKKSGGIVRFALPEKIGAMRVGVEVNDLRSVFMEEK